LVAGGLRVGLDDSIGFILNHAGRRVSQLFTSRLQPYGITTEQWTVLSRLAEQDGISQKLLAQRAEKDQTNLTRILDQLERKGLVERKANAADRRSFLTYITAKGKELQGTLAPIEQRVVQEVTEGLSAGQIAELRTLLTHMTHQANHYIREVEEQP
jgi:DNA-binding MarR family transcriptional regulator